MIDQERCRFIDHRSIKNFLKRMGHLIKPKEVECVVRRLDIDGDGKITFDEFFEAISSV